MHFIFLFFTEKAWDDVERKEKPKEQPFNYRIARPLDQEKSKQSLAEVYEQEYLKQMQVGVPSCISTTFQAVVC